MTAEDVAAISKIDRETALGHIHGHLSIAYDAAEGFNPEVKKRVHNAIVQVWDDVQRMAVQIEETETGLRCANALIESARAFATEMQNQRDAALDEIDAIVRAFRQRNTKHYLVDEVMTDFVERAQDHTWEQYPEELRQALGWTWDEADTLHRLLTIEVQNVPLEGHSEYGFTRRQLVDFREKLHQFVRSLS